MTWIEQLFKKQKVNLKKCIEYGFVETTNYLFYQKSILDNAFLVRVEITKEEKISCHCLDQETMEEYIPVMSSKNLGRYAARVKEEYVEAIEDVIKNCFDKVLYSNPQTLRILEWVQQTFQESVEYPYKNKNIGILQNKRNEVRYAVISIDEDIEKIEIKLDKEQVQSLLQKDGFFIASHQNKDLWIAIALNDTIKDQRIKDCLSISRGFTLSIRNKKVDSDMWLIPSNPKYYDVVGALEYEDTIIWNRHTNVKTGDVVFLYVGKPYSAILYRFVVREVDEERKLMVLQKEKQFDATACTLTKMRQRGVNTPRGARSMPKELLDLLQ